MCFRDYSCWMCLYYYITILSCWIMLDMLIRLMLDSWGRCLAVGVVGAKPRPSWRKMPARVAVANLTLFWAETRRKTAKKIWFSFGRIFEIGRFPRQTRLRSVKKTQFSSVREKVIWLAPSAKSGQKISDTAAVSASKLACVGIFRLSRKSGMAERGAFQRSSDQATQRDVGLVRLI